jgi:two-component system nitrogen regulation sensor histidine kinase NtrY
LSAPQETHRRRRDNRLVIGLALAVLIVWSAVSVLEQRASEMEPATITRGLLLFVLSYLNVTLIAAVLFVLARTLVKLWLERRRAVLGARFKTKLLVTYIGLTAIPIGLLFITATGLFERSIDRWFSGPAREVVRRARIVEDLAEKHIGEEASAGARALTRALDASRDRAVAASDLEALRRAHGLESVEIYRDGVRRAGANAGATAPPPLPHDALETAAARGQALRVEVLADRSRLFRAAVSSHGRTVVAGIRVPPAEAQAMSAIAGAWSDYQKLETQKPSIKAANVSSFLLITLTILFASIWTGMALARRITVPITALSESTRRIRAGDLSARVDVRADDELGVLVESFNSMAAGLEETRAALLRSNNDLHASNLRLDVERGLLATVLESVTTGVLAIDRDGRFTVANPAARALLSLGPAPVTLDALRARPDLAPLVAMIELAETARPGGAPEAPSELVVSAPGGERRLEIAMRPLSGGTDGARGWVFAIEDTTHVARAQKLAAWSEVARRVAHEIKNPLTPIRLSAERMARRLRSGDPDLGATIERGTRVIIDEVDFLKSLVDEFSRFARFPQMRAEPTDLAALACAAVRLFEGAREGVSIRVDSELPPLPVTVDPDQIKRALINLIDNALAACGASGEIVVRLCRRPDGVTIEVADTGHGVPRPDRDRLFLPDFTTKGRATGLGLAIVSRIVADHNGSIRVEDNRPRGARFIIELPAA